MYTQGIYCYARNARFNVAYDYLFVIADFYGRLSIKDDKHDRNVYGSLSDANTYWFMLYLTAFNSDSSRNLNVKLNSRIPKLTLDSARFGWLCFRTVRFGSLCFENRKQKNTNGDQTYAS